MKTARFLPRSWCRLVVWAGLTVAWLTPPALQGAGLAAFKQQTFHTHDLAEIIVYASIRRDATTWYLDLGTKEFNCPLSKIVETVTVYHLPGHISTEGSVQVVRRAHAEMTAFAARYAKAAPVLKPHIEQFEAALRRIDRGEVLQAGKWVSKEEFEQSMRAAEASSAARPQPAMTPEQQAAAFAAEQRGKGLELHEGQWLPKAEVAALQQRDEEVRAATAEVDTRSPGEMLYSVFQVLGNGLLVRPHGGAAARAGLLQHDLVLVDAGAENKNAAEGTLCRRTLHWCGTYTYPAESGKDQTVQAYCLDREDAIARARKLLAAEKAAGR